MVSLYSLSVSYTSVSSSTAASIFISCLPSSSSSSSSSVSTTPRPKSLCVNLAKIKESSTCAAEADAVCCCWRRYNNNNKKYEDDKAQKTIRHNNEPSKIANASHSAQYIRYMYSGIYHTYACTYTDIVGFNMCETKCRNETQRQSLKKEGRRD